MKARDVSQGSKKRRRSKIVFDKYEVQEPLGRGGMAEVYRAISVGAAGFQRPVVLKRILPHLAANRHFVDMFVKEASIAASLDHPNIVQVFDLGEDQGDLFMIMEYVPGTTLGNVMQHYSDLGKSVPHQLVAYVAVDVCKALECAHNHLDGDGDLDPFIHRDVSPQNVLISLSGTVKLADFGLAMALGDVRVTMPGVIKGKLGYVSPEQAAGERELDTRADLFSLGVVMYEAMAGRRLFIGASAADTIRRVKNVVVTPLSQVNPQVPPVLEELIHRLLARDPDERPDSARDVRQTLSSYLRGVHPPVDATVLSRVVRYVMDEADDPALAGRNDSDDVLTAAYLAGEGSNDEDFDDERPTLAVRRSSPGPVPPPMDEPSWVDRIEQLEAVTVKPAQPLSGESDAVLIRRIIFVGEPDEDDRNRL